MENKFTEGDIVKLKSGGPVMTVDGYNEHNNRVRCVWFDDKKVMQTADFLEATLQKHNPAPLGGFAF